MEEGKKRKKEEGRRWVDDFYQLDVFLSLECFSPNFAIIGGLRSFPPLKLNFGC